MWRTSDEIEADLRSGRPERIAAALETLEFHMDTLTPVEVAPLTAELLSPFGTEIPEDVASRFIKLISRYTGFDPSPSRNQIGHELALSASRFGPSWLALEASLYLKDAEDPAMAIRNALAGVAARGIKPDEIQHASNFISYLLAGNVRVRAATVDTLIAWRERADMTDVIRNVAAELDDAERERVAGQR